MTYYRHLCQFCGWVFHEYRVWNVYPDMMHVTHQPCELCLDASAEAVRQPTSWFDFDYGEAGA